MCVRFFVQGQWEMKPKNKYSNCLKRVIALHPHITYCISKMEELGDQYESVAFDRFHFPTKTDVSNLWQANFKKTLRGTEWHFNVTKFA